MTSETLKKYLAWQRDLGGDEVVLNAPFSPLSKIKKPQDLATAYRQRVGLESPPIKNNENKDDFQRSPPKEKVLPSIENLEALYAYSAQHPCYKDLALASPSGPVESSLAVVSLLPVPGDDFRKRIFAGEDGELLDKMLRSIGWSKERVYATSVLKNSKVIMRLNWSEKYFFARLVQAELAFTQARRLLILGEKCAQLLLKTGQSIEEMRQWVHTLTPGENGPVWTAAVTHHPFELLKNTTLKHKAWEDLQWFQKNLLQNLPA